MATMIVAAAIVMTDLFVVWYAGRLFLLTFSTKRRIIQLMKSTIGFVCL
jgi:hypothetical protein